MTHDALQERLRSYCTKSYSELSSAELVRSCTFSDTSHFPDWALTKRVVICHECEEYSCHDRCQRTKATKVLQAMYEYLLALEAKRALPSVEEVSESILSTCALFDVGDAGKSFACSINSVTSPVLAYFAEQGDSIRSRGVDELRDLICTKPAARFRPWSLPCPGSNRGYTRREQDFAEKLRLERALWRLTRLELTEMTAEDAAFASLWLDAFVEGSLGSSARPPSAVLPEAAADEPGGHQRAALGQLAALMRILSAAMLAAPPHLIRSRCEIAMTVMKPDAEVPESFGRLNWGHAENGPPRPLPREGRFTLFARLPRSAETGGPLPTGRVAQRIGEALVEAKIVAAVSAVRGGGYGYVLGRFYAEQGTRPPLSSERHAELSGLDAEGRTACIVDVGASLGPAPAFDGGRYGNLVTVHWLGTPDCKAESSAVKRAIRPAALALAGQHPKDAGKGGGGSGGGGGGSSGSGSSAASSRGRLTAWGCCAVHHSVVEVSVPNRPDFLLRATSGAADNCDELRESPRTGADNQAEAYRPSTLWALLRSGEEVARCLMTYRNNEVGSYGPTIELFGVRNSARGAGLGRVFLESIARELKGGSKEAGWFPKDAYFGLQLCDVVSAHAFFEKAGFSWDEEVDKDGEGFAQGFNLKAAMGAKYQDAVRVVHRVYACGHCGGPPKQQQGKLQLCSRCRCALYCSTECQRADWANHKLDCKKRAGKNAVLFKL